MTSIRLIWLALCLLWISAEIRLSRDSRTKRGALVDSEGNSQTRLWLSTIAGLALALWLKHMAWLPIGVDYLQRQSIALPLFLFGLGLRFVAIHQLGRFFSADAAIQREHRLITAGIYRRLRHPAYSGLLLALAAAGWAMGDFLALCALTFPVSWAIATRIAIEEHMLERAFGNSYRKYCERSWKLLPWLY